MIRIGILKTVHFFYLDLQAIARAHRIGQKNTVNVYRFISKDTIEEDIIERAKRKMVLEYSIIKTMDTSGEGIMQGKGKFAASSNSKSGNITNEELQTILKFGAQNLFKQDQAKDTADNKLEQFNLDDVLARAEFHEGVEQSGTALGSAEFLEQFNVADVAVNQLSWDELIPEELRQKEGSTADMDEIPEEFLLDGGLRRRNTKNVNYKGADALEDGGSKRKRKAAPSTRRKTGDTSKMSEKDLRSFIKGMLKFGDIERRFDQIIEDTSLGHKTKKALITTAQELLAVCQSALGGKKRDVKATLASYGGLNNINATQYVQRVQDLVFLVTRLENQNISSFRITWTAKPILNWSCTWTPIDDAMLLAGVYKYGFGEWEAIQADQELNLGKKFFLDASDKWLPKGQQLGRRAEYLLKLLKDNEEAKYLKKVKSEAPLEEKSSAPRSENRKAAEKVDSGEGPSKSKRPRKVSSKKEADGTDCESMDEGQCKEYLRPVKRELRALESPSKSLADKEKAKMIKKNLSTIARHIDQLCATLDKNKAKTEKHLWKFASFFWPTKISSTAYKSLCSKILEATETTDSPAPSVQDTPRVTERSDSFAASSSQMTQQNVEAKDERRENGNSSHYARHDRTEESRRDADRYNDRYESSRYRRRSRSRSPPNRHRSRSYERNRDRDSSRRYDRRDHYDDPYRRRDRY